MIVMNVQKLGLGLLCVNKKRLKLSIHRLLHSNKIIRVRFAPSPTGMFKGSLEKNICVIPCVLGVNSTFNLEPQILWFGFRHPLHCELQCLDKVQ